MFSKMKGFVTVCLFNNLSNINTIKYERDGYIRCKGLDNKNLSEIEKYVILLAEENTPFTNHLLYRIGENQSIYSRMVQRVICGLWKPKDTLFFHTLNIGEGLLINHGFASIIIAKSIGRDCLISQQVTIGVKNPGGRYLLLGKMFRFMLGLKY